MNKVSIVDFVHALFKSNVIDICKRGDEYLLSTRTSNGSTYADGREIIYSFDASGVGSFAHLLTQLGKEASTNRPYFKEGDKERIAEALLEDIKKKHPDWSKFLDDRIEFKKGGKGYAP